MNITEIKALIIENISEVFIKGVKSPQTDADINFNDELSLIKATYVKLERDFSLGIIDYDTYTLSLNRIRLVLLNLFNDYEQVNEINHVLENILKQLILPNEKWYSDVEFRRKRHELLQGEGSGDVLNAFFESFLLVLNSKAMFYSDLIGQEIKMIDSGRANQVYVGIQDFTININWGYDVFASLTSGDKSLKLVINIITRKFDKNDDYRLTLDDIIYQYIFEPYVSKELSLCWKKSKEEFFFSSEEICDLYFKIVIDKLFSL